MVTGDLSFSPPIGPNGNATAAINVSTSLSGPVVIDLKGHTLTGNAGVSVGVGIGFFANTPVSNTQPITIRNGTLRGFAFGVWAENSPEPNTGRPIPLFDITVSKLNILTSQPPPGNGTGIIFDAVSSSTVNNCSFHGGSTGIQDSQSDGGNSYNNDAFFGVNPLSEYAGGENGNPLVLNHCQFDAPPTN